MRSIHIQNATEGNLKHVSLEIPKEKLVVFTGLSGSGKSTLLVDVLFNECQRQYLEAMSMQGIQKPRVERIRNASPAIVISQTDNNRNPRSTVGTASDVYTDLRMVYEKLGVRQCPHCARTISAADCVEETEKIDGDFYVYMYCNLCGKRMDKVTRTEFSFNTESGACPVCEGLGRVFAIDEEHAVDESLSLAGGAVSFWEHKYKEYQIGVLFQAYRALGVPIPENVAVANFSDIQKDILLNGVGSDGVRRAFPDTEIPKSVASGRFEGVYPMLWRKLAEKGGDAKKLDRYFASQVCPTCHGERLGDLGRSITVEGVRLPELSGVSIEELFAWVSGLSETLDERRRSLVEDYLLDIKTKLQRFLRVGLGYLSLDRQIVTLSGGELQRVRLAGVLDSELSGIIYILDEPTVGLHPKDTAGMVAVLKSLRDLGNTVLVIEHDTDVMREADYIVDVGPGSGVRGGEIVAFGSLEQIESAPRSVTGRWLREAHPAKKAYRNPAQRAVRVRNATRFNLRGIDLDIPRGCLTSVTGPSGSGKSTLVFEVIARGDREGDENAVDGCAQFDRMVVVGQAPIAKMKRSNVATYSEAYADVRKVFAATADAKRLGLGIKHFSFNTPGGRCERCEGLGFVTSNMLFFNDIELPCPACQGKRFSDEVLSVRFGDLSISDVLDLSVEEAARVFCDHPRIARTLGLLDEVGLGYLALGQSLTTLSGGESQRLKLAKELIGMRRGSNDLYLLDESTTGLHPQDVNHFLTLVDRLIDAGATVVVVEHNAQVIERSDWVIDLGPEGGDKGGSVVFAGTPADLLECDASATARCLRSANAR